MGAGGIPARSSRYDERGPAAQLPVNRERSPAAQPVFSCASSRIGRCAGLPLSGFRPLTARQFHPPRCGVRAKGRWARPFAIRALRQPPLFPHSAAPASRTARIRHPWLIPLSQRHPCRFVLAVTLRSALRMALNTLACRIFFFFLCGVVWGAVNGSAETVAGCKRHKTYVRCVLWLTPRGWDGT